MILELDTSLLSKLPENITLSQFVFINVMLHNENNPNQICNFPMSLLNFKEIDNLINLSWIEKEILSNGSTLYKKGQLLENLINIEKTMFDEFYEIFPAVVIRPDGTKAYLRFNIHKCRKQYEQIVGKSKAKHSHILKCLSSEITERMKTGKLGYMKSMWKWLVNNEWEIYDERLKDEESLIEDHIAYGTNII